MESQFYPVPENDPPVGGAPGQPCGSVGGNTQGICDCLDCSLGAINSSLQMINQTLYDKLGDPCSKIDGCIDKIVEKLREKLKQPALSCEQCRDKVRQGLAGTLEFAVQCAGACINECETICSAGDPTSEGKCCKTCGKEKCKCVKGECLPVDEPDKPDQQKTWYAWCNRTTGLIAVSEQGKGTPGPDFEQVGLAQSEQSAIALAQANCGTVKTQPTSNSNFIVPSVAGCFCDIASYQTGEMARRITSGRQGAISAEALAVITGRIRQAGFENLNLGSISDVVFGAVQYFSGSPNLIGQEYVPVLSGIIGCNTTEFQEALRAIVSIGNIEKVTGIDVSPWVAPYNYVMNASCRKLWLSPNEATAAFLADAINTETLDTIYAIHGFCPDALNWNVDAQRSKPIPGQLAVMRHRQMISASEYHAGMRQLGYLEPEMREKLFELTTQVPTLAEIIRFMVRDAGDESADGPVNRFNLDYGFYDKYGSQLRKWSEDQGITEDHARYNWRSHWAIPSPTQLFQFIRRLRHNPAYPTLMEDVKQALIQQDILPFWHEHYLSVIYNPLTRVDVRRAFNLGSIDEQQVTKAYADAGYSDENSEILTKFTVKLRDQSASNHKAVKLWLSFAIDRPTAQARLEADNIPSHVASQAIDDASIKLQSSAYAQALSRGDMTVDDFASVMTNHGVRLDIIQTIIDIAVVKRSDHPILKDYYAGVVDRETARQTMDLARIPSGTIGVLLDQVDAEVNRNFVVACQRGIKSRFLLGEITQQEAIAELENRGTVHNRAVMMASWWGCELKSGRKQVSASKLCDWLAQGVITAVDYTSRLVAIGYSDADAALMLQDCLTMVSAKRLKQAEKEAKDRSLEQARQVRAIAQAGAAEIRNTNRLNAAREKAARIRTAREKSLITAAGKVAKKCDCDLFEAVETVKLHYKNLQNDYKLSHDQALKVLTVAADQFTGPDLQDFGPIVDTLADGLISANVSGESVYLSIPPSTNGHTDPSS